ncbi:MAG: SPOR domain-containing protein [Candidatus Delongbacteria bacterium]|nr:SPOR domain-containing protein [Candidatus Delongbacteria bacterium]
MRSIILTVIAIIVTSFITSCAPSAGINKSAYGPNDPSNKIVIEEDLAKRDMIDGYRIKIANADTEPEALLIEKQVAEAVQEPVYIEFIVDKYMIYAGDCQNKEEANILKEKLISSGFEKVYSVPKKVFKKSETVQEQFVPAEETANVESDAGIESAVPVSTSFEQIIGYRVQIGAFQDKEKAEKLKEIASRTIRERIYIVRAQDNLYKVQFGDYLARIDAEKKRDEVRQDPAYGDAFIQNSYILYDTSADSGEYFIQVGAFSSQSSADDFISNKLIPGGYLNSSVYYDKNLYKVIVGGYNSNSDAQAVKEKLNGSGFEGAWIIQK